MTVSFDTLSFAEAHAMALKEFVMDAVATKADIRDLSAKIEGLRGEVRDEFVKVRSDLSGLSERFATKDELRHESLLHKDIDAMISKLTLRWAGMLAVAVGAVAALGKVI